ncbi:mutator family transposase [Yoonia sediminilitoris]|uniref:Mutator family transposase n=1 Tax=Yoonia sediminilitoris TaxID=1286148 RepID=A0A2T6K5P3_9RHOB|nr:mutator family transposase [Yoonia sediminilitoris]RCW89623.1 mutator family transposase [Yoonia sediminilitoris]
MNERKNRGLQDVFIAVVDGLKGFPEAITAAFPEAMVQTCIVDLVRHGLNFCSWKDQKVVAADLRRIYSAPTAEAAETELDAFGEKWAGKYAFIAPAWRRAWAEVVPFFASDPAIRKIIYTTNAIENLNRVIRKSIKTRGSFPTDEAATKLIYLAIRNFEKDGRNVREWFAARNQFAICSASASTLEYLILHGPGLIHKVQDTPAGLSFYAPSPGRRFICYHPDAFNSRQSCLVKKATLRPACHRSRIRRQSRLRAVRKSPRMSSQLRIHSA